MSPPYGRHLLHRYEDRLTLHVHLGLFGRFVRCTDPDSVPARETCRLRIRGDELAWDLSGAVASKLLEPSDEDQLLARLGPDPLRNDADPERFAAALARRGIAIAAALMDQSVLAGVGNVYAPGPPPSRLSGGHGCFEPATSRVWRVRGCWAPLACAALSLEADQVRH